MTVLHILGTTNGLTRDNHYRDQRSTSFVRAGMIGNYQNARREPTSTNCTFSCKIVELKTKEVKCIFPEMAYQLSVKFNTGYCIDITFSKIFKTKCVKITPFIIFQWGGS